MFTVSQQRTPYQVVCAIGGWDGESVARCAEWYDPHTATWRPGPSMSEPRKRLGVVAHCGKVYAIGGHDGKVTLSSVEVYCQRSRRWTTLPSMNQARMFSGCVVLNNRLYVIGGQSRMGAPLDTAEVFDFHLSKWGPVARLGGKLGSPAAVAHNNSILVFGRGASNTYSIHIYSPSNDSWDAVPTTLPYHMYAEAVKYSGGIYILCGRSSSRPEREGHPSIYRYDVNTHQWAALDSQIPSPRAGFSATVLNGDIFVVGGHKGTEKLASVDLYDPMGDVWRQLPDMPGGGRCVLGAVAVDQLAPL